MSTDACTDLEMNNTAQAERWLRHERDLNPRYGRECDDFGPYPIPCTDGVHRQVACTDSDTDSADVENSLIEAIDEMPTVYDFVTGNGETNDDEPEPVSREKVCEVKNQDWYIDLFANWADADKPVFASYADEVLKAVIDSTDHTGGLNDRDYPGPSKITGRREAINLFARGYGDDTKSLKLSNRRPPSYSSYRPILERRRCERKPVDSEKSAADLLRFEQVLTDYKAQNRLANAK